MEKILELLRFYKKNNTILQFRLRNNNVTNFQGKIVDLDSFFPKDNRSVVISDESGNKTKVFLDDINIDSLIPLHLISNRSLLNTRISIPPKLRFDILKRDDFKCFYCGKTKNETELEIDHFVPVSKGGTNNPGNLVTSCFDCNRGKGGTKI